MGRNLSETYPNYYEFVKSTGELHCNIFENTFCEQTGVILPVTYTTAKAYYVFRVKDILFKIKSSNYSYFLQNEEILKKNVFQNYDINRKQKDLPTIPQENLNEIVTYMINKKNNYLSDMMEIKSKVKSFKNSLKSSNDLVEKATIELEIDKLKSQYYVVEDLFGDDVFISTSNIIKNTCIENKVYIKI